jgi:hypothetical protein
MFTSVDNLKELSSGIQYGSTVVSIGRYCSSVRMLDIPIFILKGLDLGFIKDILSIREAKLLVTCERIGEALKLVCTLTNL